MNLNSSPSWKQLVSCGAVLSIALGAGSLVGSEPTPTIVGEYAEARTCDVWTGPCFANGEMNLRGDHAVLAWKIDRGSWLGTRLDGLVIVLSIDAEGTLGTDVEGAVRGVAYCDSRATKAQRRALVGLVQNLAPAYTKRILKVKSAEISYRREGMRVAVQVGKNPVVKLETTPLRAHCDLICGNEDQFYPALAKTTGAECAKTVVHFYRGKTLGPRWSSPNARSALVGRFKI